MRNWGGGRIVTLRLSKGDLKKKLVCDDEKRRKCGGAHFATLREWGLLVLHKLNQFGRGNSRESNAGEKRPFVSLRVWLMRNEFYICPFASLRD